MAQLADIQSVVVGPRSLVATVRIAEGAPLMTSEDVEATARVYWLMPKIAEHVCLGDAGEKFQDAMGDTELAHLMEHVAVELIVQSGLAGDITCGRTRAAEAERTYEIELACPDDVLVTAALSSAAWILQWAFGGADPEAEPDIPAIVEGIAALTASSYGMPGDEAAPAAEAQDEVFAEEPVDDEPAPEQE